VLRQIFGPKMDEGTGDWRRLHNEELLLRKQGPRQTPQMHRSLEAYCATLGPP